MHPDKSTIEVLSVVPVIYKSHKQRIWFLKSDTNENIRYNYIPFINLPVLKELVVLLFSFFKTFFWCIRNSNRDAAVICDSLNLSITTGAFLACKITGTKIIAIVTDMPNLLMSGKNKLGMKSYLFKVGVNFIINRFSGYVLLTPQMNAVVNPRSKPFIIMEGLVDAKMQHAENDPSLKAKEKIIIYAGGIYEQYGVKSLIEAFMQIHNPDARLHIYGPGAMQEQMLGFERQDSRISYKGIVPNAVVVDALPKATLLVNPRPSTEEFTKYSFPSKNMECMVSGTPLLTTALPGMPAEYNEHVYLFKDESTQGITETLQSLLELAPEILHEKGLKAKQFVLQKKNNALQADRILNLLSTARVNRTFTNYLCKLLVSSHFYK